MIPNDSDTLKKMQELSARNIANGDWGDEVTFPGEVMPRSPEEAKNAVSHILSEMGDQKLPKRE